MAPSAPSAPPPPASVKGVERRHDAIYLEEERKATPKENFKFLANHVDPFLATRRAPRLLDLGCATGDFLHYLAQRFPRARLTGVDYLEPLLEKARREVPGVMFQQGDVNDPATLPAGPFDVVFMVGVHTIFEACEPWLDAVAGLLGEDGRACVFGSFNPDPVDTLVTIRRSGGGAWEKGWHLWSLQTVCDLLTARGLHWRTRYFEIPIDLPKHPDDPMRTWTEPLADGRRLVVNGAGLVRPLWLVEFSPAPLAEGTA